MFNRSLVRAIPRLYTSYYKGELSITHLAHPRARAAPGLRAHLQSPLRKAPAVPPTESEARAERAGSPTWSDAESVDIIAVNEAGGEHAVSEGAAALPQRPYVPISELAQLELKGDYLVEGGMAEAALRFYGAAAKGYIVALEQRPQHAQIAKILIKLGRAFRLTKRNESAEYNLRRALDVLDGNARPDLEAACECLLELGLVLSAAANPGAGAAFEDVARLLGLYHDLGDSHRFIKNLPKLCRDFVTNQHLKFVYISPFDTDRCFALADQALQHAEDWYRAREEHEDLVRVLEVRAQLLDRKFFNMNELSSKIRTMRGRPYRAMLLQSNAPTATEILQYTPTLHQVHRDYSLELTAPLGREHEVQQGVNRRVVDDGSPRRKKKFYRGHEAKVAGSLDKFYQNMQWE